MFKSKTPRVQPEREEPKKPSLSDIIEELKRAKARMYEEEERERERKEKEGNS